jgi:hypothetical protein
MSLHPSLRNFGERPGDRVSAEWVSRIQDEVTAARSISAAPPLVIEDGIGGPLLWLDPTTITLRRVVLDEELVGGWYAAGEFLLYDAAAKTMTLRGDPVTVYDSAHDAGVVVATSGATVYVSWHADSGRWEVVTSQPSAGDFFPASIAARRRVGSSTKVWQYTCERLEFDTMADLPSEPSDSALGEYNTVEINNRRVQLGTIVWLKHVFGDSPTLSFEVTTAGNEADVSTAFELFLDDVSSGTFTLTVDGDETSAIASDATAADIKTELESATGLTFTSFSGSGTRAEPWTFSETGSYASRTVDSDADDLTGTKTYAFEYDGEKYFPAKITSSELVDGVPSHSWVEMCATGPNVPLIVKSGGRSGTKATVTGAVGYNGRRVNDGTIVNMTSADDEGDGDGTVTITRTQNGNGSDTPTIWEVVINASEGTYTLAMDGGTETSELDYTAGTSAVDAAIEAASGETVSMTGDGLPGDPWIITVTSDFASHTLAVVTNNLVGAAFFFDDAAGTDYYWTSLKTSDYSASVWEAIPVQPGDPHPVITLPSFADSAINDRVLIAVRWDFTAGVGVKVEPYSGDRINGSLDTGFQLLLDASEVRSTVGASSGGSWEFRRSNSLDEGWVCTRHLQYT